METELKHFKEFREVFGPQIEIHPHWDQHAERILRITQLLKELLNHNSEGELLEPEDIPFCRISLAQGIEIFTQITNHLGEKTIASVADSKNLVSNPDGTTHLEVKFATLDVSDLNLPYATEQLILAAHLTLVSPSAYKTLMALNALGITEGDNYDEEAQRVVDFYMTGYFNNPPE